MRLICESNQLEDYLQLLPEVDFNECSIQKLANSIFSNEMNTIEKTTRAFHYVRDQIGHSWDIQQHEVTCTASEVLKKRHGICYAKTNLLAALLRSQGIPTGFCYQRLMLFDTPEKGYSIHALNAVYINEGWIRLDARGNKPGVNAQFSLTEERLAFNVNPSLNEVDYPIIYIRPNHETIKTLHTNKDALFMYLNALPEKIN